MSVTASQSGTVVAPVIETERLRLRPHHIDDLPECIAMWSDPTVVRYTIGEPSSPQRTWMRVLAYRGHWSLLHYGYWALEERSSGRFVGEVGFSDFKRELLASIDGVPELGWVLAPQFHGKGYATEALSAALNWGDQCFAQPSTVCIIHPSNQRSFRVAEKLGYMALCSAIGHGATSTVLARQARSTA